jgi:Protein HRI1
LGPGFPVETKVRVNGGRETAGSPGKPGPAATLDSFLLGAWTRSRLVVDGARCVDRCWVLWLQTPVWYADIRVPSPARPVPAAGPEAVFARQWAFAGTATWSPPVMTWHHHLDSMREPISDANPLDREGDLLVEAGTLKWAGLAIPFREEWRRLSQDDDDVSAQVDTNRIQVTIGVWRILIQDERPSGLFQASGQRFQEGAWRTWGTILDPARP